ncbi:hypothetical protein Cri9333_1880 [Crinalium epipsammum PCC 9333]|uniref:Uncharacterized protein n=1 Tax=Crinalium epipsammum PCC 9333 TaxID=1173022 RepID=K9VXC1_9CYAN|nr:hypothetical protein [Crinalium epipsammum]AFZ12763.1 hypothetical protein Cri9333_1880 [Crinalium epipsammum PCC 9333]
MVNQEDNKGQKKDKENDAETTQDSGMSAGISAGLKLWLFFMLSFVLVGNPIPFSIFLGAIGGLSGGLVFAWWNSTDEKLDQAQASQVPTKVSGFRRAKLLRNANAKYPKLSKKRREQNK